MSSQVKFIKKKFTDSIKNWEDELNLEGRKGWKVIQVFQSPDGLLTAVLRKDT